MPKNSGKTAGQDNIIPHKFKKGQSGNPSGRPKGTKNFKTILTKIFETLASNESKSEIAELGIEVIDNEDLFVATNFYHALKGDSTSKNIIMERFYGKQKEEIEHTILDKTKELSKEEMRKILTEKGIPIPE